MFVAHVLSIFYIEKSEEMKNKSKIVIISILVLVLSFASIQPDAHALKPATWSHKKLVMQKSSQMTTSSLAYYNHISPVECAHYATTSNQCSGTDTTYGTFSYATPESYGVSGSCDYPCESQDVYINYPSTFTYGGTIYYFSNAQQDQCATNFGCSTETTWTSDGPVDVPYSGTPVGIPVQVDTQVFYTDSNHANMVEIEFTYNLDNGYNYG